MPEGPECRQYAEALAKRVSGKSLKGVEIVSGRYSERVPTGLEEISKDFPISIVGAGVHGKFIYIILDNEWSMWNTLGMTGNWSEDAREHPRVKLNLNDGDIFFNDQRNFGTIKFVKGKFTLIQKLKSLGPDMLVDEVSDDLFIERLRKKNTWQITTALMNQTVVAGVGNYVKAEALWLSRISPHKKVSELSDERLAALNGSIKTVMKESFKSGGATIRSYKNFNGEEGDYARRFLVYNQKTDPDGNEVVREMTEDQRTTHWCPAVQH